MSRSSSKPPKYSLHKATRQARVQIDGKSTYLGVYGTPESRRLYDELIAKFKPKPDPVESASVSMPVLGNA
jgi:hypothetical protein